MEEVPVDPTSHRQYAGRDVLLLVVVVVAHHCKRKEQ